MVKTKMRKGGAPIRPTKPKVFKNENFLTSKDSISALGIVSSCPFLFETIKISFSFFETNCPRIIDFESVTI